MTLVEYTHTDGKQAFLRSRQIIQNKSFLKKVYQDFYQEFKNCDLPKGKIIELGSGGGFIKEVMLGVITSDVIGGGGIDMIFAAEKMPFKNDSIAAFLMLNVLHHIKNPQKAFDEMQRCLKKGGKIIMIEPYASLWGKFIYKYAHPEKSGYDDKGDWNIKRRVGMSEANPALPWVIFVRDRHIFAKKYPQLEIEQIQPHSPLKYLIAGGLYSFQLLPGFFYPLVSFVEGKLRFLNNKIGMFATIKLQKIF